MAEQEMIFINRANRTQLESVEHFDKPIIDAILNHRRDHGKFASIDELEKFPGVDNGRLDLIRQRVKVAD